MNLYELLREAPIEDFQVLSNFKQPNRGWKPADRRLLTHPKTVERVKNFFRNSPYDIRILLVNSKESSRYVEVGIVSMEWLEYNMYHTFQEIKDLSYPNNPFGEESINIIYTNNSGSEWRPMSPWIMAHRMGHAIFNDFNRGNTPVGTSDILPSLEKEILGYIKDILANYRAIIQRNSGPGDISYSRFYNIRNQKLFNQFLCMIGPSRACRENKLRNGYEFIYECFAKYLVTGSLEFRSAPEQMLLGYAWGKPRYSPKLGNEELTEVNHLLSIMAQVMEQEFDRALSYAMGKVMVM